MNELTPLFGKSKYQEEKELGLRSASGAKHLKKLTGKHLTCINYHLAGESGENIAKAMGMTQPWVSSVLNDPLAKDIIERRFIDMDMELRALMPKAISRIRDGLNSADPTVYLSATDKYFRSQGLYNPKNNTNPMLSAEDLVRQLLAETNPGSTTTLGITVRKSDDASSQ